MNSGFSPKANTAFFAAPVLALSFGCAFRHEFRDSATIGRESPADTYKPTRHLAAVGDHTDQDLVSPFDGLPVEPPAGLDPELAPGIVTLFFCLIVVTIEGWFSPAGRRF